jgi:glycosyltransferase involved in cell wall biosynthesis
VLDACSDRALPYVITLHDAWWLCERQFMVTGEGHYCAQRHIDLHVCQACIPTAEHLRERADMSLQRLSGAARLLFPSVFHRDLHLANGIDPKRAVVNRNGVRWPARPRRPREDGPVRFGYVGGNDRVKGFHLIRQAFEKLSRTDYRLILTDNTMNMGFSSMRTDGWRVRGELRIVPAYRQDTMDDFFESIDVLLFPSQWKESFGLTVREALIRDVWVIATDGGGTVEDIVDGVNGTILPFTAKAADLRAAIEAVLACPDRLAGHVNPHKERVTTYDAQAAELHAILSEIVRGQPA